MIIKFTFSSTTLTYRITSFTTNNTVINLSVIDDAFPGSTLTQTFTIDQDSIELTGALRDRGITTTSTSLASPQFLNREVFIHKVFINPETGALIGNTSVLVFKGTVKPTPASNGST